MHFTALFRLTSPLGLTLSALAGTACLVLLVQARGRSASVAGVWLAVAAFACLLDITINVWVPSRYTVGWYVSRANTLMSAGVVLGALLHEVTRLYARLTQANADLHASEQRLQVLSDARAGHNRALLDAIPDMMFHLSPGGMFLNYKASVDDLVVPPEAFLGQHVSAVLPADLAQQILGAMEAARRTGTLQTIEYALPLRGEAHHYEARLVGCGDAETMVIVRDVSARKRLEDSLWHQALHDALTGLPNRTLLHERLQEALCATPRARTPLALLLLDLDRFKDINDTFGHPQGDAILQQVATRLREAVRATDLVARLGGDEFAVLLPDTTVAQAQHIAHTLWTALDAPLAVGEQAFQIGASIGLSAAPAHGQEAVTLLRCADVAMYAAKRDRSGCAVYDPAHDQHSPERLGLVADLRQALERDELVLHYQPKVDVATGQVCGVEALVRWPHPARGLIPPDQFIGLAEHTGLIKPLTYRVLELAVQQSATWHRAGQPLEVAVNLSMANLHDPHLVGTILELLERSALPPASLRLELTESSVMADMEQSLAVLTRLSRHGVRLSIDDFGTGYSSLAYLKQLPVDELKIDRSFVQHMATEEADTAIVRSVIALAHALGRAVVAEGVEDAETWDLLAVEGGEVIQGYYVSRPLPSADLERWLREASWRRERRSA